MAKFTVVAFENKRYEICIEADTKEEALKLAALHSIDKWNEDCEYHEFDIACAKLDD